MLSSDQEVNTAGCPSAPVTFSAPPSLTCTRPHGPNFTTWSAGTVRVIWSGTISGYLKTTAQVSHERISVSPANVAPLLVRK